MKLIKGFISCLTTVLTTNDRKSRYGKSIAAQESKHQEIGLALACGGEPAAARARCREHLVVVMSLVFILSTPSDSIALGGCRRIATIAGFVPLSVVLPGRKQFLPCALLGLWLLSVWLVARMTISSGWYAWPAEV